MGVGNNGPCAQTVKYFFSFLGVCFTNSQEYLWIEIKLPCVAAEHRKSSTDPIDLSTKIKIHFKWFLVDKNLKM